MHVHSQSAAQTRCYDATKAGRWQISAVGACKLGARTGNLLSEAHIAGINHVIEAVHQLRGKVFSWTVIHRSQTPGFEADTPYAVVLVELDAAPGVRMIGNLHGAPPAALRAALPVEAVFTRSADDSVTLVNWRPIADAGE